MVGKRNPHVSKYSNVPSNNNLQHNGSSSVAKIQAYMYISGEFVFVFLFYWMTLYTCTNWFDVRSEHHSFFFLLTNLVPWIDLGLIIEKTAI